jgi:NAD(P)-dependent dehydrogenase (short-subunit alcohol dehydrogenase family)
MGSLESHAMNLFDLTGRTAIVTGAAGHLGRAMAAALAQAGARVLLNGRDSVKVEDLAERLRLAGWLAEAISFDVRDEQAIEHLRDRLLSEGGGLDVLVNNAYAGRQGSVESATAEDFQESYQLGVIAPFRLTQMLLEPLTLASRRRGQSSVINIASMYGMVSPDPRVYGEMPPNPPFYGAAKGGLLQITRYLACHLATRGIRVNAISPGPFPADRVQESAPDFIAQLAKRVPLGRVGKAQELMGPVVFLASDASSFVTGSNLVVDGGWTAW